MSSKKSYIADKDLPNPPCSVSNRYPLGVGIRFYVTQVTLGYKARKSSLLHKHANIL